MDENLRATLLWQSFMAKAEPPQQVRIDQLLSHAGYLLDRIVETFPTYTLHNREHAVNVVHRMGDLLGPRVSELTALEAGLLLLTAYWHDVGMYNRPDELSAVVSEEAFQHFLAEHPKAFVAYETGGRVPSTELVEWYCRWNHADRVYRFLDELSDDDLSWDMIPLREKLGEVCRSHNLNLQTLKDDEIYETNFVHEADLRFCAILLRLADILDFDRSRSPESVYRHLGLATGQSERLRASNAEWRKHQAAQGFIFPRGARDNPYGLPFIAMPDDPGVEHDLREFLSVIDAELRGCASLMRTCSDRWRDHALPFEILRDFRPRGYKYGAYRFELDRQQILTLFMGETLYSNPYVFLRELLQNSIDATRHRTAYEIGRRAGLDGPEPIDVTDWLDEDGYRWVRVDDYGMGMSEHLLLDYFLAVGRSYYRSDEFEAELLRYANAESRAFTPISRFGIGVLSCFIAGDRVEVSTRHVPVDGASHQPLRVSLRGLESFYVVQTHPWKADPMPSKTGPEPGYRALPGTSIAVRLGVTTDSGSFSLPELLRNYLLAVPVPVTHHGEPVPEASEDLAAVPWFSEPRELEIPKPLGAPPDTTYRKFGPYKAIALPLNLTAASPDPRFSGQMAAIVLSGSSDDPRYTRSDRIQRGQWLCVPGGWDEDAPPLRVDLGTLFGTRAGARAVRVMRDGLRWAYNGVALPESIRMVGYDSGEYLDVNVPLSLSLAGPHLPRDEGRFVAVRLVGWWCFRDDLRIELSASRDVARSIGWELSSLIQMTIQRAALATQHPVLEELRRHNHLPLELMHREPVPALATVMDDPLLDAEHGWQEFLRMPVINDVASADSGAAAVKPSKSFLTLTEIAVRAAQGPVLLDLPKVAELNPPDLNLKFSEVIGCVSARMRVGLAWKASPASGAWGYVATGDEPDPIHIGERDLPPMSVLSYEGTDALRESDGPLNKEHPLTIWLLESARQMHRSQPGLFGVLLDGLLTPYRHTPEVIGDRVERINGALNRLRQVNFEPRPSASIQVELGDFR